MQNSPPPSPPNSDITTAPSVTRRSLLPHPSASSSNLAALQPPDVSDGPSRNSSNSQSTSANAMHQHAINVEHIQIHPALPFAPLMSPALSSHLANNVDKVDESSHRALRRYLVSAIPFVAFTLLGLALSLTFFFLLHSHGLHQWRQSVTLQCERQSDRLSAVLTSASIVANSVNALVATSSDVSQQSFADYASSLSANTVVDRLVWAQLIDDYNSDLRMLNIVNVAPYDPSLINVDLLTTELQSVLNTSVTTGVIAACAVNASVLSGYPQSVVLSVPFYNTSARQITGASLAVVNFTDAIAEALSASDSDNELNIEVYSVSADTKSGMTLLGWYAPLDSDSVDLSESVTTLLLFYGQSYSVTCLPSNSGRDSALSSLALALTLTFTLFIASIGVCASLVQYRSQLIASHLQQSLIHIGAEHSAALSSLAASEDVSTKKHLNVLAFFLDRLNNPLHQILSLLTFLSDTGADLEIVSSIKQQAEIMTNIVSDALDINKLETGSLTFDCQPIHIHALLASVLIPLKSQARDQGCHLLSHVSSDITVVYGDSRRVAQVLSGLIGSVLQLNQQTRGNISVSIKPMKLAVEQLRRETANAEINPQSPHNNQRDRSRSSGANHKQNKQTSSQSPPSRLRFKLGALYVDTDRTGKCSASPSSNDKRRILPPRAQSSQLASPSTHRRQLSSHVSDNALTVVVPKSLSPSPPPSSASPSVLLESRFVTLCIKVRILGFSLKKESVSSLFDPFNATKAGSTVYEGLGLALVSKITAALKGRIELRSGPQGTTFIVMLTFPLDAPTNTFATVQQPFSPVPSPSFNLSSHSGEDEFVVAIKLSAAGVQLEPLPVPRMLSHLNSSMTDMMTTSVNPQSSGSGGSGVEMSHLSSSHDLQRADTAGLADNGKQHNDREDAEKKINEPTTVNDHSSQSQSLVTLTHAETDATLSINPRGSLSAFPSSLSPSPASSHSHSLVSHSLHLWTPPLFSPTGRSFSEAGPASYRHASPQSLHSQGVPTFPYHSLAGIPSHLSAHPSASPSHAFAFSSQHTPVSGRRHSNVLSEMSLMTRQVQEAKMRAKRDSGAHFETTQQPQPLSLIANSRRLSDSLPTIIATNANGSGSDESPDTAHLSVNVNAPPLTSAVTLLSGDESMPRCVSEPPHQRLAQSAVVQSLPSQPVNDEAKDLNQSPPMIGHRSASSVSAVRSHTTTILKTIVAPNSSPGPARSLPAGSATVPALVVLPQNYALVTPPQQRAVLAGNAPAHSPSQSSEVSSVTPPLPPRARHPTAKSASKSDQDEKARIDAFKRHFASLSMLVVDDSDINIKIALRMLAGFDCVTATDGQQAVEHYKRTAGITEDDSGSRPSPFGLVLMDVVMPVMDGRAATRAIRSLEQSHGLQHVPIIAVTANCTAADRKAAASAGFDLLLPKPFTRAQLFECMNIALKNRSTTNSAAAVHGNGPSQHSSSMTTLTESQSVDFSSSHGASTPSIISTPSSPAQASHSSLTPSTVLNGLRPSRP